jgi:hypothetical protein
MGAGVVVVEKALVVDVVVEARVVAAGVVVVCHLHKRDTSTFTGVQL